MKMSYQYAEHRGSTLQFEELGDSTTEIQCENTIYLVKQKKALELCGGWRQLDGNNKPVPIIYYCLMLKLFPEHVQTMELPLHFRYLYTSSESNQEKPNPR